MRVSFIIHLCRTSTVSAADRRQECHLHIGRDDRLVLGELAIDADG
jgi:hypothetical protein